MKFLQINAEQVKYLVADNGYCWVYFTNSTRYFGSWNSSRFAKRWPHFVRISRGVVVNPACIQDYHLDWDQHHPKGHVNMTDGRRFEIPRRRMWKVSHLLTKLTDETNPKERTQTPAPAAKE